MALKGRYSIDISTVVFKKIYFRNVFTIGAHAFERKTVTYVVIVFVCAIKQFPFSPI